MNLAPYIAVARSCFAYHYMPGLLYAELLYCVLVNTIPGRCVCNVNFLFRLSFGPSFCERLALIRLGNIAAWLSLAVILVSFVYWCPWVYALPLHEYAEGAKRWMDTWD
jgi:dolichyl-phosphate-mannose--protein O-mannosyl transferase